MALGSRARFWSRVRCQTGRSSKGEAREFRAERRRLLHRDRHTCVGRAADSKCARYRNPRLAALSARRRRARSLPSSSRPELLYDHQPDVTVRPRAPRLLGDRTGAALHPHLAISHSPTPGHGLVACSRFRPVPSYCACRTPCSRAAPCRPISPTSARRTRWRSRFWPRRATRAALPLSILPDNFDTPLFWSPAERAHLEARPPRVGRLALLQHRALVWADPERWAGATVVGADGATHSLALDDFRWALSVAWSRSFMVGRAGRAEDGDARAARRLLNHAEEERANVERERRRRRRLLSAPDGRSAATRSSRSYGAQGEPSNAILMLDYGFCLPYSSHDTAAIDVAARHRGVASRVAPAAAARRLRRARAALAPRRWRRPARSAAAAAAHCAPRPRVGRRRATRSSAAPGPSCRRRGSLRVPSDALRAAPRRALLAGGGRATSRSWRPAAATATAAPLPIVRCAVAHGR